MQNNFDKFNYLVGCVFALLQDEFPCRHRIDFIKLIGAEQCSETYGDGERWTGRYLRDGEIQDLSKEIELAYETIHWLHETGYLIGSVDINRTGRYAFVTLSPKALEILKVFPTSVDAKPSGKSIGQELSEAVKSGAKSQVSALTSKALSYLFKVGFDVLSP
jgi:hypothetical protein